MTDAVYINKCKEISLTDSEYSEEMIRYNIDYEVVIENNMPVNVLFKSIVRTEFKDGKDKIETVSEDDMPYFMRQNIIFEELEGWAY